MAIANAGLAIMTAGLADDVLQGMNHAIAAIDSGDAARTLERLRVASHQ